MCPILSFAFFLQTGRSFFNHEKICWEFAKLSYHSDTQGQIDHIICKFIYSNYLCVSWGLVVSVILSIYQYCSPSDSAYLPSFPSMEVKYLTILSHCDTFIPHDPCGQLCRCRVSMLLPNSDVIIAVEMYLTLVLLSTSPIV